MLILFCLLGCTLTVGQEPGAVAAPRWSRVTAWGELVTVYHDAADGRCHAIMLGGRSMAYLGVVPCEVPR